jgi:mannose-6-phosphate isomerase
MPELLPPLKFQPIIKPLPWGGRKLESIFNKSLPPQVPCGESWEVVDLPEDQSLVAEGPLAGRTLGELVAARRDELLGEVQLAEGRFPLLLKFIDAREKLSLQVHPDEQAARKLGGRPKNEAWYIIQAEAGAEIYLGLRPGCSLADLKQALSENRPQQVLQAVPVQAGDFFLLPAGMLHGLGEGILLAEIQQPSDTTFRLYDWGRLGLDGKPRPLHLEQALESIRLELSGRVAHARPLSGRPGLRTPWFSMERARLETGQDLPLDAGRPRLVCCLEGRGNISCRGGQPLELKAGECSLIPACRSELLEAVADGLFLLMRA